MGEFMSIKADKLDKSAGLLRRFKFRSATSMWAHEIAPILSAEISKAAPVRTGALAASTQVNVKDGGVQVVFSSELPYAPYVIHGTPPHEIVPRVAKALHWVTEGSDVFATHVNHPGTRPNPYPQEAGRAALAILGSSMAASIRTTMET